MAKRRVYWDACVFLGLLNQEPGKIDVTLKVWEEAKRGDTEIWTSAFSLVEVFKAKCEGKKHPLDATKDQAVNDLFAQPFVELVLVDRPVGELARRLLRAHQPTCKKPTDGLHLASAAFWNVDELHTWDEDDLTPLNGMVARDDGRMLVICTPYVLQPANAEGDSDQRGLFEREEP